MVGSQVPLAARVRARLQWLQVGGQGDPEHLPRNQILSRRPQWEDTASLNTSVGQTPWYLRPEDPGVCWKRQNGQAGGVRNSKRVNNQALNQDEKMGQEGHYSCKSEGTNHLLQALWPFGKRLNCVKITKTNPGLLNGAFPASRRDQLILLLTAPLLCTQTCSW